VQIAAESKDVGFVGLFGPRVWKRTVCGLSVQMWQQLLGGNVMLYYLVYIFNMAGLVRTARITSVGPDRLANKRQGGNSALTSAIVQYVIFVVTTGAILPIIDRIGRRFLLLSGAVTCAILHFTSGALMASYGHAVDSVDGESPRS